MLLPIPLQARIYSSNTNKAVTQDEKESPLRNFGIPGIAIVSLVSETWHLLAKFPWTGKQCYSPVSISFSIRISFVYLEILGTRSSNRLL
jgi:hypothetical protein